eukprot:5227653-Alexandrium_andersonii.AAC.1
MRAVRMRRNIQNDTCHKSSRGSSAPRTPQEEPPARPLACFVSRFGICAKDGAECTLPELG